MEDSSTAKQGTADLVEEESSDREGPLLRWIILIDKQPQGPFTEPQVLDLIKQGQIKHTDLAVQILENDERHNSGWKFLWQFPEFDRRKKERGGGPGPKSAQARRSMSESEIKRRVAQELPPEMYEISVKESALPAVHERTGKAVFLGYWDKFERSMPGGGRLWLGIAVGLVVSSLWQSASSPPGATRTEPGRSSALVRRASPHSIVREPASTPPGSAAKAPEKPKADK